VKFPDDIVAVSFIPLVLEQRDDIHIPHFMGNIFLVPGGNKKLVLVVEKGVFFAMRRPAGIPLVPDTLSLERSSIDLLSWFCTQVMYMGMVG